MRERDSRALDAPLHRADLTARTDSPEANAAQPLDGQLTVYEADSDRHDLDDVEHARQDRLSRWQKQPQ